MGKSDFTNSIFKIAEFLTRGELSGQAKKLIIHYFNQSKESSSKLKAVEAVEKYVQEKIPDSDIPDRLKYLLEDMFREADSWDNE